jgi:hypothetical protein
MHAPQRPACPSHRRVACAWGTRACMATSRRRHAMRRAVLLGQQGGGTCTRFDQSTHVCVAVPRGSPTAAAHLLLPDPARPMPTAATNPRPALSVHAPVCLPASRSRACQLEVPVSSSCACRCVLPPDGCTHAHTHARTHCVLPISSRACQLVAAMPATACCRVVAVPAS